MESLKEFIYLFYAWNHNALISIMYFLKINWAFALYFMSAIYVFDKRSTILEKETIKPFRRTLTPESKPILPHSFEGLADNIVAITLNKERLNLIARYAVISLLLIINFFYSTEVILYMTVLMWIVGAISVWLLKGDRKEMATTIENYALGYLFGLLLLKIMISIVVGMPMSSWSRSFGVALPSNATGTITGYLPMLYMILTVGIPFAYFKLVGQRYLITKDNRDIEERRAELLRTGNANQLSNYEEDYYKRNFK